MLSAVLWYIGLMRQADGLVNHACPDTVPHVENLGFVECLMQLANETIRLRGRRQAYEEF